MQCTSGTGPSYAHTARSGRIDHGWQLLAVRLGHHICAGRDLVPAGGETRQVRGPRTSLARLSGWTGGCSVGSGACAGAHRSGQRQCRRSCSLLSRSAADPPAPPEYITRGVGATSFRRLQAQDSAWDRPNRHAGSNDGTESASFGTRRGARPVRARSTRPYMAFRRTSP